LLVADQNVKFARHVADRGYVIEKGYIRYSGRLDELWQDQAAVQRYLAV
jgi:branched-chain amino acid transport system ATP-binding protein